ncbi:restriction endonuclease subunit S [Rhizobium sp. PAMB 3174]
MSREVPEGWVYEQLDDVCEDISVGIASSATHAYRTTGVPLIRNQNINYGRIDTSELLYLSPEYDALNASKRVRVGDVVSMRTGYPGRSALVPACLEGAQTFTTLITRPDKNRLLPAFLVVWMNSDLGGVAVQKLQAGGAQQNLNVGALKTMPILLPPLHEQRRIAEVLSSVEEAIAATRAVIVQTRKVKHGVLERLLTRGIGHTRLKQTEIGEIPEEWEVAPLSTLLDSSTYGLNASLRSAPVGTPILRMGNIQDGELSLGGLKYAVLDDATKEKHNILRGDLLFNRTNSRELVGKIAIARETIDASFASYLIRLRVNRFNDPFFIHAVLSSPRYQNFLRSIATPGASQANINATKLGNTVVPVPPIGEPLTPTKLMHHLNEQGIQPARGSKWSYNGCKNLLNRLQLHAQ